jgi:hypothetical protein
MLGAGTLTSDGLAAVAGAAAAIAGLAASIEIGFETADALDVGWITVPLTAGAAGWAFWANAPLPPAMSSNANPAASAKLSILTMYLSGFSSGNAGTSIVNAISGPGIDLSEAARFTRNV